MGGERGKDDLITPQWLMKARKARQQFILRVVLVFAVFSVLAFWALPTLVHQGNEAIKAVGGGKLPAQVSLMMSLAGAFKAFWVVIAIGCGAGVVVALTGKIDTLLPTLSLILLLAGLGAVAFTFYVFYLPSQILSVKIR